MKQSIPILEHSEKKRLQRLFAHVLPKSYQGRFNAAYRRTVSDLTLFQEHYPEQRFPDNSPEAFLRWISADVSGYALQFQLNDVDSICYRAHSLAKSLQAKAARAANGQATATECTD
jgi:hypothetical protein